jgi:hypothetical protein
MAKFYNVAAQTEEPKRVNTTLNSQRSTTSNAVLVTLKPFRYLEACNLVTATTVLNYLVSVSLLISSLLFSLFYYSTVQTTLVMLC